MSEVKKESFFKKLFNTKWIEKVKKIKHIDYILVGILCLVILIIFFSYKTSNNSSEINEKTSSGTSNYKQLSASEFQEQTEKKLSNILSSIKGAGNVKVFIVVDSSPEIVYATTESTETNSSGIIKKCIEYTQTKDGSSTSAVVLKTINPKITGILIVASGAKDVKVSLRLFNAVSGIFDISSNKIQVLVGE